MKLFVQIPCFNEENTLPLVIANIPRKIEDIDEIYTIVIDDGSTDNTVEVAKELGVNYIIRNGYNIGLAKSFSRGIEACLFLGADIIVNTDGDNQYKGADIAKLVKSIIEKQTDIVVGCRNIKGHKEFSFLKRFLQGIGSKVVRHLSNVNVPDTTSGFRAVRRNAAIEFCFISTFSYTIEMLIQAGRTGLKVDWIPIRVNPKSRDSHLLKSIPHFIFHQLKTMVTVYLFYRPMQFFGLIASLFFVVSTLLGFRMIYYLWFVDPSMVKLKAGSGILLLFTSILAFLFLVAGLLGSVLSGLRFLMADLRHRIRNTELQQDIKSIDVEIITEKEFSELARAEPKSG